jgi:hypothetical protein
VAGIRRHEATAGHRCFSQASHRPAVGWGPGRRKKIGAGERPKTTGKGPSAMVVGRINLQSFEPWTHNLRRGSGGAADGWPAASGGVLASRGNGRGEVAGPAAGACRAVAVARRSRGICSSDSSGQMRFKLKSTDQGVDPALGNNVKMQVATCFLRRARVRVQPLNHAKCHNASRHFWFVVF